MIMGSKTSLIDLELKDRKSKGVKFIEIQATLDDFKDLKVTLEKKHLIRQYSLSVYAVHVPILNSYGSECILGETNALIRKDNLNLIKKSIILADKFSDLSNPYVIIPTGGLVKEGEFIPDFSRVKKGLFQKDLWELRNYVTENYPRVTLLLKNNPMVKKEGNEYLPYAYGYEDDFMFWIKELKDSHLGIALDVANAMGTVRYNQEHNSNSDFMSIEYFFYRYAPFLKLIHLSNGKNFSSQKDEYGLPFLSSEPIDVQMMKNILFVIHDLKYTSPITITTNEDDSQNAVNFLKTRDCIVQSFKK
ncbi:hypothetical protein CVD28_04260 [Bacillus sp. M6-12]|uniref:hypothetical protein n=1 Tax=Bacillus sp. M6-12 TaxID=2054166 RepID=UPI000C7923CA|nr:hypothetical protein [Bacillus sp. M6-12]PLS19638.1 hypothetical protein CVD28_04260 [Bacillus sp. M6-12]